MQKKDLIFWRNENYAGQSLAEFVTFFDAVETYAWLDKAAYLELGRGMATFFFDPPSDFERGISCV
jgi:hypothetical protein